mmetsp:Transcript_2823/g.3475  ORF Transcript_2823/g.3475 Transcript_2823/m.3475 type:complete len:102 (-) Transcript_2823:69-374(-)
MSSENLHLKIKLGERKQLTEKIKLLESKYVVDMCQIERKFNTEIDTKEKEIIQTKKQMSVSERKASRVQTLENEIKSLQHCKKYDNQIQKIIRLGLKVDEK